MLCVRFFYFNREHKQEECGVGVGVGVACSLGGLKNCKNPNAERSRHPSSISLSFFSLHLLSTPNFYERTGQLKIKLNLGSVTYKF